MTADGEFDESFRSWATTFCRDREKPDPPESWFSWVYGRLPLGLQRAVVTARNDKILIPARTLWRFTLRGVARSKSYAWFSDWYAQGGPNPNWEYIVQVAEYARLWRLVHSKGYTLRFEDERMDITVSKGRSRSVLLCVETKFTGEVLDRLMRKLRHLGRSGLKVGPKPGDHDARQKAGYLLKCHAPEFAAVAIGRRYEYRVEYPKDGRFELYDDVLYFP